MRSSRMRVQSGVQRLAIFAQLMGYVAMRFDTFGKGRELIKNLATNKI
jgi:hypothetical protein